MRIPCLSDCWRGGRSYPSPWGDRLDGFPRQDKAGVLAAEAEGVGEGDVAAGLALRRGQWKYIEPNKRQAMNVQTNTELGNSPEPQLYDLASDPGERTNLAPRHPEKVAELQTLLERVRKAGRSR